MVEKMGGACASVPLRSLTEVIFSLLAIVALEGLTEGAELPQEAPASVELQDFAQT